MVAPPSLSATVSSALLGVAALKFPLAGTFPSPGGLGPPSILTLSDGLNAPQVIQPRREPMRTPRTIEARTAGRILENAKMESYLSHSESGAFWGLSAMTETRNRFFP